MQQGSKDIVKFSLVFRAFFVYNDIFRTIMEEQIELEQCPYCGIMSETPCESPPADICEQAITYVFFKDLQDAIRG